MSASPLSLPAPETSTLVVIDVQERLLPAMEPTLQAPIVKHIDNLVALYAELGGVIVASEQYPKGLGPTIPALASALATATQTTMVHHFEKVEFSLMQCAEAVAAVQDMTKDIVLTGMETHVCVLTTGLDLLARGHRVWVPFDAVASRQLAYRDNGLELLERAGAVVVNTESLVFASLGKAGGDRFKRFSARVR